MAGFLRTRWETTSITINPATHVQGEHDTPLTGQIHHATGPQTASAMIFETGVNLIIPKPRLPRQSDPSNKPPF